MRKPSIVFLGCGKIAKAHSKRLRSIDPAIPQYFASRSIDRAEQFSRELKGRGAFGSYDEAVLSPQADTAFVCTPPDQHLELALGSIEAGKHVIVEKPPFFSIKDFDSVADAASRKNVQLLVAENYFYKPLAVALRRLLAEGVVGTPLMIHVNALKKQDTDDWRDDPRIAGGGALFEGGIHWINFLANLGPRVASIRGFRPGRQTGLDRSALAVIQYEDHSIATLSYSWEVPTLFQGLRMSRIFGTAGSITFETNGLFVLVSANRKRVILPGLSDISGYEAMLKDFVRSLSSDESPQFTTELARQDMALLEQAYATMNNSHATTGDS